MSQQGITGIAAKCECLIFLAKLTKLNILIPEDIAKGKIAHKDKSSCIYHVFLVHCNKGRHQECQFPPKRGQKHLSLGI